ncbi:MAG: prepilin-type N-terminal cleavage/methylation domain-containing protein [Tepidisphaeraceae bacterium]
MGFPPPPDMIRQMPAGNPMLKPPDSRRRGHSLTEILVCFGIIMILLGILLTTIAKAVQAVQALKN